MHLRSPNLRHVNFDTPASAVAETLKASKTSKNVYSPFVYTYDSGGVCSVFCAKFGDCDSMFRVGSTKIFVYK